MGGLCAISTRCYSGSIRILKGNKVSRMIMNNIVCINDFMVYIIIKENCFLKLLERCTASRRAIHVKSNI